MNLRYTFFFCFLSICLVTPCLHAQKKQTELGIVTSNLQNFSLNLKRGSGDRFIRYSAFLIDGETNFEDFSNDSLSFTQNRIDVGIGFGITFERRKKLSERLTLLHGPGIGLGFHYSHNKRPTRFTYYGGDFIDNIREEQTRNSYQLRTSLRWRVGIMYNILDNLYCSGEVAPIIGYRITYEVEEGTAFDNILAEEVNYKQSSWIHSPNLQASFGIQFGLFYRFGG